jgi:2-isopropylmalate synthase
VYSIFLRDFVNLHNKLIVWDAEYETVVAETDTVYGKVDIEYLGKRQTVESRGSGRLDCVSNAIKKVTGKKYHLENYVQHALEERTSSVAASYVCIVEDGTSYWGVGTHNDIIISSIYALVSAVNRLLVEEK